MNIFVNLDNGEIVRGRCPNISTVVDVDDISSSGSDRSAKKSGKIDYPRKESSNIPFHKAAIVERKDDDSSIFSVR